MKFPTMLFQVTKLCDLGPDDGVCAVQWTREGSYVSVGTSNGQVQVNVALALINKNIQGSV